MPGTDSSAARATHTAATLTMNDAEQSAIAIIADAHCHDMQSDYGLESSPLAGRPAIVRSWQDSRRSSRVFNESTAALLSSLERIRHRGIRHVVLLGDYTDDGQTEATRRLRERLRDYQQHHGMAFYAIPGNHDCYGPHGKHQSTRFVSVPGETVLVTSDPDIAATEDDAVLTSAMYCQGTGPAVQAMADFGLFPQPHYLHWETPFGLSGELTARQYTALSADAQVERRLIDASYLVEPVAGIWLLLIDANVFEPRNGQWSETRKKAFLDSSDAGWNSVLRNRPHLLPWISDVCRRAQAQGKRLFGFSHYPVMDPFDDHSDLEGRLFGQTDMRRRRPSDEVAKKLIDAGLQWHFGGHLHVNGLRQWRVGERQLTDVAVPSTASFPAAFQIIHAGADEQHLETVPLSDMALEPELLDYYRAECRALHTEPDPALSASHYGEFLYRRMHSRLMAHYLPEHWPAELAEQLQSGNAAELARFLLAQRHSDQPLQYGALSAAQRAAADSKLQDLCKQAGLSVAELEACQLSQLLTDWYCLRQAGHQACNFFQTEHLPVYHFLSAHFATLTPAEANSPPGVSGEFPAGFLTIFLGGLQQYLQTSVPGSGLRVSLAPR